VAFLLNTNVAIHLRDGDPLVTQRVAALEGANQLYLILGSLSRAGLVSTAPSPPIAWWWTGRSRAQFKVETLF
jgi:hypothetical protein